MPTTDTPGLPEHHQAVLVRMRSAMPQLRPSEQRIAALFLSEPSAAAALSIADLASRCETSTTSVVRFSKRMGYGHLRQLRMDVLREVTRETFETAALPEVSGDIDRNDTVEDIVAKVSTAETMSIADTAKMLNLEALSAAIDAVAAAGRVDIFGAGASSFVGLDLQQKLIRIGRVALNWPDTHAAWTSAATLEAGSVALAVSHSGTTADTIRFLALARAGGATTIALTNHEGSELAGHADIVLTTAARETGFRSGALGSRIAQLMVVDCVFIGVAQSNYDRSLAALRNTYAAIHRDAPAQRRATDQ
ncbi:MurR/RpiR family transcriptional regulator [Mycetocola sp.]|jgi:DNA-binding MurR/RpiR family transcriptional regulator|uniref:MurR/RpiR family transcriptional regulator n=1 Tax=Mycetocola sp. TaxID=1871042 RepID=UPI0026268558|nr:MurR/RpiR family transcriptional regulator [Mycetocola sp.]MCU1560476.1 RpiR family transcriptional regulator [Mycetocola sp.]